jgi:hypothetical protein
MAGFWRRSDWDHIGGLDANLGPQYADLDLALMLEALGRQCVVEPNCRIVQRVARRENAGSWSNGRSAEKLFWKHAGSRRGLYALHALGLAGEFAAAAVRPRRVMECAGRLSVLIGVAFGNRHVAAMNSSSLPGAEPIRRRDGANLLTERERRTAPRNAVQTY